MGAAPPQATEIKLLRRALMAGVQVTLGSTHAICLRSPYDLSLLSWPACKFIWRSPLREQSACADLQRSCTNQTNFWPRPFPFAARPSLYGVQERLLVSERFDEEKLLTLPDDFDAALRAAFVAVCR